MILVTTTKAVTVTVPLATWTPSWMALEGTGQQTENLFMSNILTYSTCYINTCYINTGAAQLPVVEWQPELSTTMVPVPKVRPARGFESYGKAV